MAFKRSWVRSPPSPPNRKRTIRKVGTFSVLVLRETVRERTGRRSAERKKGAGGTLFSPRVDPQCTFTDNTNDIRKVGTFSVLVLRETVRDRTGRRSAGRSPVLKQLIIDHIYRLCHFACGI